MIRITQMRKALGLSQADLGARCIPPLAQSHVARAEAGEPSLRTLRRLAVGLGLVDCASLVRERCSACGAPVLVHDSGDGVVCSVASCGWYAR